MKVIRFLISKSSKITSIAILFFFISPLNAYALELKLGVNHTSFQTDTGETYVTYNLQVINNNSCTQPVDTVLLFDKSGSMDDDGGNPPEPISGTKKAVNYFLDNLNPTKDQSGLVKFDSNAKLVNQLTNNFTSIKNTISGLNAGGNTDMSDAIKLGRQEALSSRKNPSAIQVLVLFSDGTPHGPTNDDKKDMQLALDEAQLTKNNNVKIVAIGLGHGPDLNLSALKQIASPGLFFYAPTTDDLKNVYELIAKNFAGSSTGTNAWVDVTKLLDVATFVSASNGGKLENNKISWNLGDIGCETTIPLTFTFKFNGPIQDKFIDESVAKAVDSVNNQFTSNPVTIEAVGPWMSVDKTDNLTQAGNNDEINYVVHVKNVGLGDGTDVSVTDTLPQYLSYVDSNIDKVVLDGNQLKWKIPFIKAGELYEYNIKAKLALPLDVTSGTILNTVQAINDNQVVNSEDTTNIFTPPPDNNPPDTTPPDDNDSSSSSSSESSLSISSSESSSETTSSEIFVESSSSAETTSTMVSSSFSSQSSQKSTDTGNLTITPKINDILSKTLGNKVITNKSNNSPEESINFNEEQLIPVSNCVLNNIYSNESSITSTGIISSLDYSLDDGENWYALSNISGLGTHRVTYSIQSPKLDENLYGIKLRAQTNSGNVYYSRTIEFTHKCSGNIVILGNYFKNGFGNAVLSDKGDVIYNNDLSGSLFVETQGPVSNLRLKLSPNKTDLAFSKDIVDMAYDYKTQLWHCDIDPTLLQHEVTYARAEIYNPITSEVYLVKNLPSIINPDYLVQYHSISNQFHQTGYTYSLYYNNGAKWEKLDYDNSYSKPIVTESYQKYNLYPGKYYFKVKYPNNKVFYSNQFDLTDPSVVRVNTDVGTKWYSGLADQYSRNLKVDIFSKNIMPKLSVDLNESNSQKTTEMYRNLLSNITFGHTESDVQILVVYWDRWNPYFSEQLNSYDKLNGEIDKINASSSGTVYRKILLIADPQNYDELQRVLKIRNSKIDSLKVTDSEFLQSELRFQPEIVIYDATAGQVKRIRSNTTYAEIKNQLINYDFLKL